MSILSSSMSPSLLLVFFFSLGTGLICGLRVQSRIDERERGREGGREGGVKKTGRREGENMKERSWRMHWGWEQNRGVGMERQKHQNMKQ